MADPFNKPDILASFVAEVRSYLLRIKANVEGLAADPSQVELLEEGFRLAHTVRNSSLIMGYPKLTKVVQPIEMVLGSAMEGKAGLGVDAATTLYRSISRAGIILDGLMGEWINDELLLQENDDDFKKLTELIEASREAESQFESPLPGPHVGTGELENVEVPEENGANVLFIAESTEELAQEGTQDGVSIPAEELSAVVEDVCVAAEAIEAADDPEDRPVLEACSVVAETETEDLVEEPLLSTHAENGFHLASARIEDCSTRLESVFTKLRLQLSEANRAMGSIMALKPSSTNTLLLSDRRYAQVLSVVQGMAAPLAGIASSVNELIPVGIDLEDIAEALQEVAEVSVGDGGTTVPDAGDEATDSIDAVSPDQLAGLRLAIESEVREAVLREIAAEREMEEQQESRRRGRYESEVRARLEAEIRAELAIRYAQSAQAAGPPVTRTLVVSGTAGDEDDFVGDLPPELLETFRIEAEDHLTSISRDLAVLEKDHGNSDALRSIRRSVHTLKGAAASMGFKVTGELAHTLEDLLDEVYEGSLQVDSTTEGLMLSTFNALETLVTGAVAERKEDRALLAALKPRYEELLSPLRSTGEDARASALEIMTQVDGERSLIDQPASLQVHVGIARLDEATNLASEMVINQSVFKQHSSTLKQTLAELGLNTNRLKRLSHALGTTYEVAGLLHGGDGHNDRFSPPVGRSTQKNELFLPPLNSESERGDRKRDVPDHRAEFDELELDRYTEFHRLTREMAEAASDASTLGGEIETLAARLEMTLNREARLNADLQDKLMRLRMVSLSGLTPRLYRAVRNVALSQGKEVELVLEGEGVEVDKSVFENISDPLLHLLRNAVDHGIELPSERNAAGKPEKGKVTFQAYHEGNQVVIKVSDDGRGIPFADVYSVALAKGLIREGDRITDSHLQDLLFQPGFSTTAEVSETSGRGMGLDIVRAKISQIRGTVQAESVLGEGTTFTIRLPLTLAVVRAQLVKSGGEIFAITLNQIERILRLGSQDLTSAISGDLLNLGGQVYRLLRLSEVLGLERPRELEKRLVSVLIIDARSQKVAVVVDEVLGQQEVVFKSLGSHFGTLRGISGATILGSGKVILILDVLSLVASAPVSPSVAAAPILPLVKAAESPRILVVDDSPSLRRIVCNMLQESGFSTLVARDGVEALEQVRFSRPDAILLDIEMPRMDGYELLSILRNQVAFRDIPVIMLTSRSGDKHRQKAVQMGANGYLVKPYRDEELLSVLRSHVGTKLTMVEHREI